MDEYYGQCGFEGFPQDSSGGRECIDTGCGSGRGIFTGDCNPDRTYTLAYASRSDTGSGAASSSLWSLCGLKTYRRFEVYDEKTIWLPVNGKGW